MQKLGLGEVETDAGDDKDIFKRWRAIYTHKA